MFWVLSGTMILLRRRFTKFKDLSALAAILVLGLALGGCASTVANVPVVGLPANTPARPETPGQYLPVHDLPPPRQETVLDPQQQEKLEKDLAAARDRQNQSGRAAQRKSAN